MTTPRNADRSPGGTALELVVGLEIHVQLATRSKIFCPCPTTFGASPNTQTCPVCLGLPGALPVVNAAAVGLATRVALALECTVHEESVFARKHYFYPDLPKGYQISQFDRPLATGGRLGVDRHDGPRTVRIARVHLEEDAGKSMHDRFPDATAVDLNRAGVPLIEIVTEPDLRSPEDARAFLQALKQLLAYLDVSDVDMEKGSLRVDANVSVRAAGETRLGTKTEVKNLNSFSAVERAIAAEYTRQSDRLAKGEPVRQETLLWDSGRAEVRPARGKEESHDYRYFPEPDLPPLRLDPVAIIAARATLPELPAARRQRFMAQHGLSAYDAGELTATQARADYFEQVAAAHGESKAAANWIINDVLKRLNELRIDIERYPVAPPRLAAVLDLVRDGAVSHTRAREVLAEVERTGEDPRDAAARLGVLQVRDPAAVARWIDDTFAAMPDEVRRFAAGERKLQGVLVGAVLQRSGGRADPRLVAQLVLARAAAYSGTASRPA